MLNIRYLFIALVVLATCSCLPLPVLAQPSGYDGYQVVRIEISNEAELDSLRDLLLLHPDFELWSEALGIGPMDVRVAPTAVASVPAEPTRAADLQRRSRQTWIIGHGGRPRHETRNLHGFSWK